jgi:methyl-accepting chemotaxis protein
MLMLRRREKDFMLRLDLKYVDELDNDAAVLLQHIDNSTALSSDLKQLIETKLQSYTTAFHELVEAEKKKGLTPKDGHMGMMRQSVHQTEEIINEANQALSVEVTAKSQQLSMISLTISIAIIILTLGISILLGRNISLPINSLARLMLQARDNKDLSLRFPVNGKDEIALMGKSFNEMVSAFQSTIEKVLHSSSSVSSAAAELSVITEQTTNGVMRQHSESDQVATAMNEMAATAQEVARHASEAANASKIADEESAKGRSIVGEAVNGIKTLAQEVGNTSTAIHTLEKESENIGSVLTVIQGIAEQTNLLALNAAIEAARAGESGRGFAVVADEVRQLAQRSQDATKEIQTIIERLQSGAHKAVKAMEVGQNQANISVEQAEAAGLSLDAITRAVTAINDMNLQIANAAEEQTAVAEEISRNVVNISQISNETADTAHQTTTTSINLANLATELQSLIGQFRLVK